MDRRFIALGIGLGLLVAVVLVMWPSSKSELRAVREGRDVVEMDRETPKQETTRDSRPRGSRGGKRVQAQVAPDLAIVDSLPPGALGVNGQVFLQATGEPLANASVYLSDHLGEQDAVMSGQDGFFGVASLRQGSVTLQAIFHEASGMRLESPETEVFIAAESAPAGPIELFVGAPASAVVTVLDREGKLPIIGAGVKRLKPSGSLSAYTDSRGRAVVYGQPGVKKYEVEAKGFATHLASVELSANNPTVTVELDREAVVAGIVVGADDVPIAGATVKLSSMVSPRVSVTSGADGRFNFENVTPFKPHVIEAAKRLEDGTLLEAKSMTFVTQPTAKPLTLVLSPHSYLEANDYMITGRVTTEKDEPIPNAEITIYEIDTMQGKHIEINRLRANEEGLFELPPFEQTTNQLMQPLMVFRHPQFAPSIDMMSMMRVREGVYHVKMRPGGVWQGRVVNKEGKPISDVSIRGEFGFTEYQLPLFDPEVILTQNDGTFVLDQLPRVGRLFLTAEGYAPKSIELAGVESLPDEVVLEAPRDIAGVVVDAASGRPIPSFSLEVQGSNVLMRGFQSANAALQDPMNGKRYFANADGRFVLEDMPTNTNLTLWFEADDYASVAYAVERQQADTSSLTVEMQREGMTLGGVVLDDQGNTVQGATVWLTDSKSAVAWLNMPRNRLWGMMTQAGDEMMSSKADGSFLFENLSEDRDWALVAWHENSAIASRNELRSLPPAQRENIVLQFPPSGGIKFVVNPDRGFDIKNISYAPSESPVASISKSLDAGEFTWEVNGLAVDTYNVRFRAVVGLMAGGTSRSFEHDTPVTVIAGEVIEVPLGFDKTYSIGGRALWSGRPLANASLFLLKEDGQVRTKVFTDQAGTFLFEDVEEGYYELFAPSNGQIDRNMIGWPYDAHPNRIAVKLRNEDVSDTFEFLALPNVVGQIANPETVGRVYMARQLQDRPEEYVIIRRVDTDGSFLFHGIPKGTYELRVWKKGADSLHTLRSGIQIRAGSQPLTLGVLRVPD